MPSISRLTTLGPDINYVGAGNFYPTSGVSLGIGASAMSPYSSTPSVTNTTGGAALSGGGGSEVDQAAAVGATGSPIGVWIVLAIMLGLLMWGSQKLAGDERFSHIRVSIYNIVIITWAAVIGLSAFKVIFTKLKVPGLSTVVLAA